MNTDFLLIRKMKRGDEQAFELFIRKYYEDILRYCVFRCSDRGYAEDLTQETFLRFFSALSHYRHFGKTRNYLYTIAGNLCRDFYKKAKDVPLEEAELREQLQPEASQETAVSDKLSIEWALGQLSEELREVTILYYFQDQKVSEIAAILHISLPLAKYRLRRAREQLEKLLKTEDYYESQKTTASL